MNSIRIKHDGDFGRQEAPEYPADATEIRFRNMHAKEVDLSDLVHCKNLTILDLSRNALGTVDLNPLSTCSELESIIARENRLESLDLWPLAGNSRLQQIDLSFNKTLRHLDITPVLGRALLYLDSSVVVTADAILIWLLTRKQIEEKIYLMRTDRVRWSGFPVIIWMGYESFAAEKWHMTRSRIESVLVRVSRDDWFSAQRGMMVGLGLGELSGYDGNPQDLLEGTSSHMSYAEAINTIHERALELLEKQISRGGSTLFLDTELMRRTGASRLIPALVEQRKREIDELRVPLRASRVYLRGLWSTHYGSQILSALGLGLRTDLQGLERIRTCFSDLGFELATTEDRSIRPTSPVLASRSLQEHINHLALGHYDTTHPLLRF